MDKHLRVGICLVLAILIAVGLAACSGSPGGVSVSGGGNAEPLFLVLQNDRYGYMDKAGKIVISAQYDSDSLSDDDAFVAFILSDNFVSSEGLIPVVGATGLWGFVDRSGKTVIEPQFDSVLPFRESTAAVSISGRYGYIDRTGKYRINPQFEGADFFFDGLALVVSGGKQLHIDKTGKKITYTNEYEEVGRFSEGLAAALKGGKWGYIDATGKPVINHQFDQAGEFNEGMAPAQSSGKSAFIDKNGKTAFTERADLSWENALSYGVSVNAWYRVGRFSEGLLAVESGDKMGYVDKTGQFAIKATYDAGLGFSGGLAPVSINGQWGYIDKTGKIVITPQFDQAFPFFNGLAMVFISDRLGYVDKTGTYIWNPTK